MYSTHVMRDERHGKTRTTSLLKKIKRIFIRVNNPSLKIDIEIVSVVPGVWL